MPNRSSQATMTDPIERCQHILERTIVVLSSDDPGTMTVVGDIWSEQLTSRIGRVSLWARMTRRGIKKVDMRDRGFVDVMTELAQKGPEQVGTYDGVEYKFRLH